MEEPILRPVLGKVAAGATFWDREEERAALRRLLDDGRSILLSGARRVGKSSLVGEVLRELPDSWTTIDVDVQDCATPAEFFAAIGAAAIEDAGVRQRFARRWQSFAERIESVDALGVKVAFANQMSGSWKHDAALILEGLVADDTVLAIDEFALLVDRLHDDADALKDLLGVLNKAVASSGTLRLVLYGSIGLDPLLASAGLAGMMTDYTTYRVKPWNRATTTGAVEAMARHLSWDLGPGAAMAVHQVLGTGVPWHVQLMIEQLAEDARTRASTVIGADDVARVYQDQMLRSSARMHMQHLESRLRRVLGEGRELALAYDLLTEAAVTGTLTQRGAAVLAADHLGADFDPQALRRILQILEHDAYLVRDGTWRLESQLLRDWWRHGYEEGFRTVEQRVEAGTGAGDEQPRAE